MKKYHGTVVSWLIQRTGYALLCVLAVVCLSMPSSAFGKSLNGTFLGRGTGREVPFNLHGTPVNAWAGSLKFKLDSGEDLLVFCIQIDVGVRSGNRYRSDGPVLVLPNGCQIRYLLDTYPASTATTADEAAARQLAIWVFSDGVDPTTIVDPTVRARTIALVTEATGKPCPKRRTEAPDLTIEPTIASAGTGQVVAYLVHASAEDAGHPVTVAVRGSAVFSDANGVNSGLHQQTINLNAQSEALVWVLITGVGQTNVTVALPYRLEAGTVYSQLDDTNPTQRLVLAESRDLVDNTSAQVVGTTPLPPPATRRPRPKHKPPVSAEQPPGTVVPGAVVGATPVQATEVAVLSTLTPTSAATAQAGAAPVAAPTPSAGAVPLPRSLPRTGAPAGSALGLILVGVAVLLVGGWLRRRQIMRWEGDK